MFDTRVSHSVMASALAAVSKYYIPDKDSGVNVGRHSGIRIDSSPESNELPLEVCNLLDFVKSNI